MAAKHAVVKAAFELESSHVCEKRSNQTNTAWHSIYSKTSSIWTLKVAIAVCVNGVSVLSG